MLSLKWILILLVLGVIGFVIWRTYQYYHSKEKSRQILKSCAQIEPTENIFVSIGSYRDSETANTIFDLFTQATCPYRVFVGVCDITSPHGRDLDLMKSLFELARSRTFFTDNPNHFFRQNLRIYPMESERARGPMVTRSIIEQSLYRNEKYYMTIDSHMKFAEHWDTKCIDCLVRCPSERPIITTLPPNFEKKDRWKEFSKCNFGQIGTFLCVGSVSPSAFPILESLPFETIPSIPMQQLFWSPCFSFTFAQAHLEVPYDRHCKNVFHGEDISMSARFWTSGWDFFCPLVPICAHMYDRSYRPTYWELGKSPARGEKRLQVLLGIRPQNSIHERILVDMDTYGLGESRSLSQYEEFTNIDFAKQRIEDRALSGILPTGYSNFKHELICKYGSNIDLEKRVYRVKH